MDKKKCVKIILVTIFLTLLIYVALTVMSLIGKYGIKDVITFKLNKNVAISNIKNNDNLLYIIMSFAISLMFMFSLKLKNPEAKIDMIFWTILALSLIIIFPNFLFQRAYYMYADVGSDTINQYYPYLVNEVQSLKEGTFSAWNFNYGLGTSIINMNAWTFDIFSIMIVLVGLIFGAGKVHFFLIWMQIVKIVVLYILTKKYLSYFIKDRLSLCLAAYLGSMNGYIFLWGQHYFLGTACIYMLLMLCAIEHILSNKSKRGYIYLSIITGSLLIFTYYIGYMVLIISALYYVFRYFYIKEKLKVRELIKDFGKCIFSVVTGLLLAGIIFLPSCYHIVTASSRISGGEGIVTKVVEAFKSSFDSQFINMRLSRLMSNNMLFINDNSRFSFTNYYELPQLFCTIFIVFFIVQWIIYEFKNDKKIKDYIFSIFKIFALYLLIFNNVTGLVLNGFTYSAYRYTYVLIPFIALVIGIVLEKIVKEKKISIIGTIISLLLSIGICIYSYDNSIHTSKIITIIIMMLLVGGFCLIPFINEKNKYANVVTALFVFVVIMSSCFDNYITTNARIPIYAGDYTLKWNDSELKNDTGKSLKWIKNRDKTFYRVEKNYSNFAAQGDSFIEQVSTNTWYNSTMTPNMSEFYTNIYCNANITNEVKFFRLNDDSDIQALYLTNSKYILADRELDFDELEEINKIGKVYIYENTTTDSIAKWYNKTLSEEEFESREQSERANLLYDNVIINSKVDIDENSEAVVSEFSRIGDTKLSGSINSTGNGILMISIPNDEGWRVYIDNKEGKILEADYGFIGIIVPKGKHNIRLEYSIPKLKEGAIISSIGIVFLIIELIINRKKEEPQ